MEQEQYLNEEIKVKSKFKIPLIIIGVLIVSLMGIGCYLYFKDSNPRDTYIKVLDTFSSSFDKALDNMPSNPIQTDYNISFNLESNDAEIKQVADLLNQMDIDLSLQTDYSSKKINAGLGVNYNNNSLVDVDVIMNETSMYANLGSLYEKSIKLPVEEMESIWNAYNIDSYKVIINGVTDILKNNLKEEYFTKESETIDIYGKSLKAEKHIMTLDGQDVYDVTIGIMNGIKENAEIINAIASISGITESEIKESIETNIEDATIDEEMLVLIEIYLNGQDVLRINLKDSVDTITLNKEKEDEPLYEIKSNDVGIGEVYLNNETIKLNIDIDGLELVMEALLNEKEKSNEIKLSLTSAGNTISYEIKDNSGNGNGSVKMNIPEDDLNLSIIFDYESNAIESAENINVSNYIELENMTDEDYNTIMTNLYNNEAFVSLFQSLILLDEAMY